MGSNNTTTPYNFISENDGFSYGIPEKLISLFVWLLIETAGNALLLKVISWYQDNQYKTLIDYLQLQVLSLVMVQSTVVVTLSTSRITFGPLLPWLCLFREQIYLALVYYQIFTIAEMFAFSYLYICVWKTVGAINEEFTQRFLVIFNSTLAIYLTILALQGNQHLHGNRYLFCCGTESGNYSFEHQFNLTLFVAVIVFLMCGLVFIRLLFEKRSGTNNTSSSSQPVGLDSSTGSSLEIVKMAKIRLIILTIVMVMTTIGKAMFRYLDGEDKNRYLRHEMLIDAYTMPLVVVFVYPMLSVYNHNFLKKKFLRMINRVTPDPMYNTHV